MIVAPSWFVAALGASVVLMGASYFVWGWLRTSHRTRQGGLRR